jgi:hypothetical protein
MILRKIFQGYAGFSLVATAFLLIYNSAISAYGASHNVDLAFIPGFALPRLAFALGFGLPTVAAAWFWKERRPAAFGALTFALLNLAYWLMQKWAGAPGF